MVDKNEKMQKRYNRVSKIYDLLEKPMELMFMSEWRKGLVEK